MPEPTPRPAEYWSALAETDDTLADHYQQARDTVVAHPGLDRELSGLLLSALMDAALHRRRCADEYRRLAEETSDAR